MARHSESHSIATEKPSIEQNENVNALSKSEQIRRIDAEATAEGISLDSFAHLNEKKILRKMDLRLIPILAVLYLMSFLDRGNIGNAKIEGLVEDLNMTGAFVPSAKCVIG